MFRKSTCLHALFVTSLLGSAARAATEVGTAAEFFDDLGQRQVLALGDGSDVLLAVEEFRSDSDELMIAGHVLGYRDAPFLVRGTTDRLHVWVYFRNEKLAYEYATTRAGIVTVEQVSPKRVCPSCEDVRPTRPDMTLRHAPIRYAIVANPTANEPHIGSYNGADLLTLQSRPSASKILYLDISGILTNGTPSAATAGNGTAWTKQEIYQVWQTVAAAYSAFDVNVTTSPTVNAATPTKNVGLAKFVARNDISVCYMDSFGSATYFCSIYATKPAETESIGFGRTVAHELGHLLGMNDAGTTADAYYPGNDTYKWYPMMGNYYYALDTTNSVVQWSKGEWTNANAEAKIDGLASIDKYLDFRADDITTPKSMVISGTSVTADGNRGQITGVTDTDDFTFTIGASGGSVNLTVDRIEFIGGAMLDVLATLKTQTGTTLTSSNPTAARKATITQASLSAGTYTLTIQGGFEGTAANGFSAYGSIGFYGIEGTITGATTSSTGTGGASGTGGSASTGGVNSTGGASAAGGVNSAGGNVSAGGKAAGGTNTGGNANTGGKATGGATSGTNNTGGNTSTGGAATGGANNRATGGNSGNGTTGGSSNATGGINGAATTGGSTTFGIGGTNGYGGSNALGNGGMTTTAAATSISGNEAGCSCSTEGPRPGRVPWFALGLAPLLLMRRRRVGQIHLD